MSPSGSAPCVLVADADGGTRTQARLALGSGSYEVVEAVDLAGAIERIAALVPDLVLLDVSLPGAGGLRLTQSLKAQPETRSAKVLLLFDKADPVDQGEAGAAGVDAFLAKPFTSLALVKKVVELLDPA